MARDEYLATSHFLGPFHPLHRYSDSAMRKTCFLDWEHRAAWVRVYNEIVGSRVAGNGTRQFMDDEGEIARVDAE